LNLAQRLDSVYPLMVQWRRHLHQHPELSHNEKNTAAYVADYLHQLGLEVKSGIGGHGIIGLLKGGKQGKTVALRADMDALPIQDEKSCSYTSQVPGVMHACGHDAHTATLMGIAKICSEMSAEINGNIQFIFQPAEEVCPGGAVALIAEGALQGVDVIYGVHLWSPFPVGTVYCRSGPIMASLDEFSMEVLGKGGHGGMPQDTIDSILVCAHLIINLQSIVSRNINPITPAVVSIGTMNAGTSYNVIAGKSTITGTVRTYDTEIRDLIMARMKQIAHSTCAAFDAECNFNYKIGNPPVVNHDLEVNRFHKVGKIIFGDTMTRTSPLIMAGEDFSYYLQQIPGCFMFVDAGNINQGIMAPHHHPQFDIDENAMKNAAHLLIGMAFDYLNG